MRRNLPPSIRIGVLGLAAVVAVAAPAQTLYRSVGPDGRISYSDRAPSDAAAAKAAAVTVRSTAAAPAAATSTLPYELREATRRHPVTLYSGPDCAPCASARTLLNARGVPFAERSVSTHDDIAALKNLSGAATLPFATIGAQPLHGFSDLQWTRLLDAAGYPKASQLPAGWPPAQALPLVQGRAATAAAASTAAAPAAADRAADDDTPEPVPPSSRGNGNPAGIRF